MPFITQSLIDNLTSTSTPADVQVVMERFAYAVSNFDRTNLRANAELLPDQLATTRSYFSIPMRDTIAAGAAITANHHMNFRIPPWGFALELFAADCWAHPSSTAGGDVQVWLRRGTETTAKPVSSLVTVAATDTLYEFLTNIDVVRDDIIEIHADTNARDAAGNLVGEAFTPISVRLWFKAPLLFGIRA